VDPVDTRDSGRIGGKRRAAKLDLEQRSESAKQAARARWAKLSPAERSEASRRMANARWSKLKTQHALGGELNVAETAPETAGIGSLPSDPTARLDTIIQLAGEIVEKSLALEPADSPARRKLILEFRSLVAEFFKVRTVLQKRSGEAVSVQTRF
jgi:hypothetical protein